MKDKNLCKWKKADYEGKFDDLSAIVKDAAYVCTKCGRAAAKKKWLCKPEAIKK